MILHRIDSPDGLKELSLAECEELAVELRSFIVEAVSKTGGHLGSTLGAVELTIALHRVFSSPEDVLLFDTGHQAYVHKLITGRREGFARLRQAGGLSGYPKRAESPHDVIENSHASTALSWSHGIASARRLTGRDEGRHVVAVVGDGALTGGMAYEALNNLGHSSSRVVIVLNDNGRSYAPTISKLSSSLTQLRLDPRYVRVRERVRLLLKELPSGVGSVAYTSVHGLTSALREVVEPHVFFEALGVRYTGPLDGHDIAQLEQALRRAAAWPGPIVLHVLTTKGKGYPPAEEDEVARLHDLKVPSVSPSAERHRPTGPRSYTDAFTTALCRLAEDDGSVVALTAAMPGPTGLLPFAEAFPERFFDVGIAEQHAMTAAAGMAREGLKPVVCIYSTFLQRCVDQWNLDVGLHHEPVVVVADRAGITGDDGPSHHGIYDLHSALLIDGVSIYCPSEPDEVGPLLAEALASGGPALVRYPKTPSSGPLAPPGTGSRHRVLADGSPELVVVGIGKLAGPAVSAARILEAESGLSPLVVDPRVVRPADAELVSLLSAARLVVTAEDGVALGGAGAYLAGLAEKAAEHEGRPGPRVLTLGVPGGFLAHGKPDDILSGLGLDGPGIATSVLEAARRYGLLRAGREDGEGSDELSSSGSAS